MGIFDACLKDIKELNHDYRILTYLKNSGPGRERSGKDAHGFMLSQPGLKLTRSESISSCPPGLKGPLARPISVPVLAFENRSPAEGLLILGVVPHGQGHLHPDSNRMGLQQPELGACDTLLKCRQYTSYGVSSPVAGHSSSESTLDLKR